MPTMSITTTAPQASRVAAAFGNKLGLGRNATEAEIKAATIDFLRAVTLNYEYEQARAAISSTPLDPT